ncbi:hypothetical protein SDC9_161406 [bioreactor metagenome]|uniref:Uncharacterized protein n=1 Tax=bioreactor metagenome TaxID=1076179 RepID=A0A645FJE0_9ZZZZ
MGITGNIIEFVLILSQLRLRQLIGFQEQLKCGKLDGNRSDPDQMIDHCHFAFEVTVEFDDMAIRDHGGRLVFGHQCQFDPPEFQSDDFPQG